MISPVPVFSTMEKAPPARGSLVTSTISLVGDLNNHVFTISGFIQASKVNSGEVLNCREIFTGGAPFSVIDDGICRFNKIQPLNLCQGCLILLQDYFIRRVFADEQKRRYVMKAIVVTDQAA